MIKDIMEGARILFPMAERQRHMIAEKMRASLPLIPRNRMTTLAASRLDRALEMICRKAETWTPFSLPMPLTSEQNTLEPI